MAMDLEKPDLDMQTGNSPKPQVAVWMVTYNHEKYIAQAIESVMVQQADFDFRLYIGEDCSTDGTRNICKAMQAKYPDKIELVLHEKNVGGNANARQVFDRCFNSGAQFVAMLEGDDYWTDVLKLQKQVGFFEQNQDYILHSGSAQVERNGVETLQMMGGNGDFSFTLPDFYTQNNLVTCTVMFRSTKIEFPDFYKKSYFGDWSLYVYMLMQSNGKAFRSNDIFAMYRIHENGMMHALSTVKKTEWHMNQIQLVKDYVGYKKFAAADIQNINTYLVVKFRVLLKNRSFFEAIGVFFLNFRFSKFKMPFRKYAGALKQSLQS